MRSTNPLVSIGVPTYNRPLTLARTLDSIVSQTYTNLEIIISDNCSSDPEVENVVNKFKSDARVKFFRQQTNVGSTGNFNFVSGKFTGDLVMKIGDDDWIDPNYIELCVDFLIKNPDYIGAYGKVRIYNPNSEFVKYDSDIELDQDFSFERMTHYFREVTQNGCYFSLLRREFLDSLYARQRLAEDWLGTARLAFLGKIHMLESTHLNLTQGGIGGSIKSIAETFGLPKFNRHFPFLSVAINVFADILWRSKTYWKLTLLKRLSLSLACVKIIYRRFNIKNEIKRSYKAFLKDYLSPN